MLPRVFVLIFPLAEAHVKMNSQRLRSQCLSNPARSVLVECVDSAAGRLVGHVFATTWVSDGGRFSKYNSRTAFASDS